MTPFCKGASYEGISKADEGDKDGVIRQGEDTAELAERRGIPLQGSRFRDNDKSATHGTHRPQYELLMAAVQRGEVDVIIVYMLGRLWHSRRERAEGIEILRKHEVSVLCVKGPELDLTTAAGRLLAGLPRGGRHVRGRADVGAGAAGDAPARRARPAADRAALLRHSVQVFLGPRNNTQRVHEDFYLRRDGTVTESAKDVVEVGLTKAVSAAYDQVRMRFIASVDGEPEAGHLATAAGVSTETAEQVLAGELDTTVGACEDFEHSPMTPDGPCTVSFLMCFACPMRSRPPATCRASPTCSRPWNNCVRPSMRLSGAPTGRTPRPRQ
ncbi:recombinase family protein [Streptomyces sp. NBC_00268]|uniref:recombinase family protein n=1 Tax=Streptomyces sp. NBC_00268 TaxID=2975695 RepID=UPI002251D726|nr:recombinase family protein [Streptomyces sp. NBC_00268]MCX5183014.1 recombinase family protein [Streptomyces sp. NBC_00268]